MKKARHRYHLGRKSQAFDVLDQHLMIVESLAGVSVGKVTEILPGAAPSALEPLADRTRAGTGFAAYPAKPDAIYQVEGIELVPTRVSKFIRFKEDTGFEEITEAQVAAAHQPAKTELPALEGEARLVSWATTIRQKLHTQLTAHRPDLLPALTARKYAGWYIKRKAFTFEQWTEDLSDVLTHGPKNHD